MTVLEWYLLFHLANRDAWHDGMEEVRREMFAILLDDLVRVYESGIIDEEGLKI